jgi:ATP-dependent Clp protease ATP-binding subunit ClpA
MAIHHGPSAEIFKPDGGLRFDILNDDAAQVLREAIRLARATGWDRLRSPHLFMGLLAVPDASVREWGRRLGTDPSNLLEQFQELFHRANDDDAAVLLNREFLSDNVIRLLREAYQRAADNQRTHISAMDLLITILIAPKSFVVQCFEHIGLTAGKLTEWAVMAELQPK